MGSRKIQISEYYDILQREYISYFVRSLIYPGKYGEKYEMYCKNKREKIDNISNKNYLPSIFSDNTICSRYFEQFYQEFGLPKFEYRDDLSREIMGRWDKIYWFKEGCEVIVLDRGEKYFGVILKNLFSRDSVIVKLKDDSETIKTVSYLTVSRVITKNLLIIK